MILGLVYFLGYAISLTIMILWGKKYFKKHFKIDYDAPKTYANCDDWSSNSEAYVALSLVWPMTLVILFIIHAVKFIVE